MAPAWKRITATGISIHRIAAVKMAEAWKSYEAPGISQQLFFVPGQEQ
jgi:hypothetical protein